MQVDRGPKPPEPDSPPVETTPPAETPPLENTPPQDPDEGISVEEATTEKPLEEAYSPSHPPLENAGLDQHAAEARRQNQLDLQREEHNERTGDASLNKGSWS